MSRLWVCFFVFGFARVFEQETAGGIVGTVKEASGSTIPGARVSAANAETDVESQVVSDETGIYQFPLLRAGRYRLTVEAPGFQKLVRTDVIVNTTERL